MSRVAFARLSDAPPPMREKLDIDDDGAWQAWRSVGRAIGRFSGSGGVAGADRILALATAAESMEPPDPGGKTRDTTFDTLTIGDRSVRLPYRGILDGPWGELLTACRDLLNDALDHPTAAIGITITAPDRVRLEHRGDETLSVEFGAARVDAQVWTAEGVFVASGTGTVDAGHVDAGPGWSIEVPLGGIDPAGDEPVVFVSFVADDGGVFIPVVVSAGRAPG
jgi:hypothetical protein